MNIAFVCNEYPPVRAGGIGVSVRALARGLVRAGHRAIVVGLYDTTSIEDDDGVLVYRYSFPMASIPRRLALARPFLYRRLAELCSLHSIDLIEWPDFQGFYFRAVPGVENVVKLHGTSLSHRVHGMATSHPMAQWVWERWERRTLTSIPNWIGVSQWFLDEWKRYFGFSPKVEGVVYNPVDLRTFHPSDVPRENLVFYSGAFRRRKGVTSLVSAAKLALARGQDFRLVMMGYEDDVSQGELRGLASPYHERLEFLPFSGQSSVAAWMRRARVFAMPSYYESCGNGWLEAAASGTPSIGSVLSCGPEVVRDGVDGILVHPDDVEAVANAIGRMFVDARAWNSMSAAALASAAERFSTEVGVRRSLDIYGQVLSGTERFGGIA